MPQTEQTVLAIIRREEKILLVQASATGETAWCLPGGVSYPGEMLASTLRRTVQEQTGLRVLGDEILVQVVRLVDRPKSRETKIYLFETKVGDDAVADVAQAVGRGFSALFHSPEECVSLLRQFEQISLRDPIVSYLSGETGPGCVWLYQNRAGEDQLVTRQHSSGF